MKKSIIIISLLIFITIGLSVTRAVLYNILSTSGVEIDKIANEVDFYKTDNLLLKEKLYIEESLHNVASRASELGFVKSKNQLVVGEASVLTRIFKKD